MLTGWTTRATAAERTKAITGNGIHVKAFVSPLVPERVMVGVRNPGSPWKSSSLALYVNDYSKQVTW